jgi:Leucine-rich repeat (LRR) protein
MIFTLVVAAACAWLARAFHHAAEEEALIDTAQKIDGRVEVAYSGPDWISFIYPRRLRRHVIGLSFDLSSGESAIPEAEIELLDRRRADVRLCLAGFRELQWLDLGLRLVDEEGLRYVGRMDQLTRLISTNSSITEAGAAQLARLPNLQELNLSGCNIDNATIRKLADCPHLQKLMLRGAVFADEPIDLGRLRGLSRLDLSGCHLSFTPTGAATISNWLSGLDALEELYLRDCPIEPGDIEAICRLKNLRILDLTGRTVSASDLRRILNLPKLKKLGLDPSSIDDETVQVLHKLGQLELLWLNDGDYWLMRENSLPSFLETWLPLLQRDFPSIQFNTGTPEYPGMRGQFGPRRVDVPDLIEEQEAGKSAGGGTF